MPQLGGRRLHVCCQDGPIKTRTSRRRLHCRTQCTWRRRLRHRNMVLLRLVAFGLLAAVWCLAPAAGGVVVFACHNATAELSCDVGSQIELGHILYKVGVGTRCGGGKRHPDDGPEVFCTFPWAEMVVEDLCANRRSCEVPVTEHVFGEYPCKEQTRYLEVSYTCTTPPTAPPPAPPAPPAPIKPDCKDASSDEA